MMSKKIPSRKECLEPAKACMCFSLRKTARAITQRYEALLRPLGLKATQFSLLVGVRLLGGITVNRLAEAMVMDRTTLTRNLKPLENQGLIQTVPGSDRREREITLTPTGESMLAKALPLWRKAQGQVQQEIGKDRFGRLLTDLQATVEAAQAG